MILQKKNDEFNYSCKYVLCYTIQTEQKNGHLDNKILKNMFAKY